MKKNLSHWNNNIDYYQFQQKKDEKTHPFLLYYLFANKSRISRK